MKERIEYIFEVYNFLECAKLPEFSFRCLTMMCRYYR